jgi:phage shock protein E
MRSIAALKKVIPIAGLLVAALAYCGSVLAAETLWIDVRTAAEFEAAHVEQAVNIPYKEIAQGVEALGVSKETTIYLYCKSGRRAGIALKTLEGLGYMQVVNLNTLEAALEQAAQAGE